MTASAQPPALARRLLSWSLPADRLDDITGDMNELFARLCRTKGDGFARGWYRREAVMLAVRFSIERLKDRNRAAMRRNRQHGATSQPITSRFGIGISHLDVKLGIRMLFKNPGLTVVSTIALAIAIAIVAGFHTATEFMVSPNLPVPEGDRVVAIWQHDSASGDPGPQTLGDALTWDRELDTVQRVGAFRLQERAVVVNGTSRLVRTAEITPSLFEIVRVPPELGRPLVEADRTAADANVAVVSYRFWQTGLNADADILGTTLRISGVVYTIVGVMPDGFAFPRQEDVWTPLPAAGLRLNPNEGPAVDFAVARLADGATLEEANVELALVGARLAAEYPETHERLSPRIARYAEAFLLSAEPELPVLMRAARLAIGILLLIVAVNVGALIYARNAARVAEIAVRMALGASRRRVVVQMFIEALVLSALAAAAGVAILLWPLSRFKALFDEGIAQGDGLPYWFEVGISLNTFVLVIGLALLSAVLTGVLPALKLTSSRTKAQLQRMQQVNLRFGRMTTLVVVSQVALSVALLTVGGAQLRSFIQDWWSQGDSPIAREQLVMADVRFDPGLGGIDSGATLTPETQTEMRRELGRRIEAMPEVEAATFTSYSGIRFFLPDVDNARIESARDQYTYVSTVEPGFFDVQGSLLSGRALTEGDALQDRDDVVVVNEAFVRANLPPGDPVGRRIRQVDPRTGLATGDWARIVGVAADTPNLEISERGPAWVAHPAVYLPMADSAGSVRMWIKARVDPAQLAGRLQTAATDIDPSLILHRVQTADESDRLGLALVGFYGMAVGFFVFAALLLSTTGVYAMMSFTITQRTREIGIRSALGAPAWRVVNAIFARSSRQLGLGTAIGLGLGYLASDGPLALSGGLFADGPGVMIGVVVLILGMGLIACGKPLRRALDIEPTEALRMDG